MLGSITAYGVGTFIHVLAVVVALGATYGYAFFIAIAERTSPVAVPSVIRSMQACDRYLVTPGLIVILLAGFYLLSEGNIKVSESWVSIGILAVIVLLGMTHAFFAPRGRRALELAERDLAAGPQLSDEYAAVSKEITIGGNLAGLIAIITIFFMVVKP